MAIGWLKLLKAAPAAKKAMDAIVAPGASESAQNWYNVVKAALTVATACGLYVVLSDEEIQTISSLLALAVPAVLTLCDMVANLWLRMRKEDSREALQKRAESRQ